MKFRIHKKWIVVILASVAFLLLLFTYFPGLPKKQPFANMSYLIGYAVGSAADAKRPILYDPNYEITSRSDFYDTDMFHGCYVQYGNAMSPEEMVKYVSAENNYYDLALAKSPEAWGAPVTCEADGEGGTDATFLLGYVAKPGWPRSYIFGHNRAVICSVSSSKGTGISCVPLQR